MSPARGTRRTRKTTRINFVSDCGSTIPVRSKLRPMIPQGQAAADSPPPSAGMAPSDARLRVLAEASHAFSSVVTDYSALVHRIARTAADLIGDGCMVTL